MRKMRSFYNVGEWVSECRLFLKHRKIVNWMICDRLQWMHSCCICILHPNDHLENYLPVYARVIFTSARMTYSSVRIFLQILNLVAIAYMPHAALIIQSHLSTVYTYDGYTYERWSAIRLKKISFILSHLATERTNASYCHETLDIFIHSSVWLFVALCT